CALVATVEAGEQIPVFWRVRVEISIEQVDLDAADLDQPAAQLNGTSVDLYAHQEIGARCINNPFERKICRGKALVHGVLAAITVYPLMEVALAVPEADADQRYSQVRCGFGVVAGQDAQTTRVERYRLMPAVLRTEVGVRIIRFTFPV